MRRLIIDTDTASDDAVAIMMALAHPGVTVEAITMVAGNVGARQPSRNARFTVELCGADVPVHEGCDRPWLRAPAPADWFHGADGMGDVGYPAPVRAAAPDHACTEPVRRFAADVLTRLFVPFRRGDERDGAAGAMSGLGLGLHFARPARPLRPRSLGTLRHTTPVRFDAGCRLGRCCTGRTPHAGTT